MSLIPDTPEPVRPTPESPAAWRIRQSRLVQEAVAKLREEDRPLGELILSTQVHNLSIIEMRLIDLESRSANIEQALIVGDRGLTTAMGITEQLLDRGDDLLLQLNALDARVGTPARPDAPSVTAQLAAADRQGQMTLWIVLGLIVAILAILLVVGGLLLTR